VPAALNFFAAICVYLLVCLRAILWLCLVLVLGSFCICERVALAARVRNFSSSKLKIQANLVLLLYPLVSSLDMRAVELHLARSIADLSGGTTDV
jgi:hypothetical protein